MSRAASVWRSRWPGRAVTRQHDASSRYVDLFTVDFRPAGTARAPLCPAGLLDARSHEHHIGAMSRSPMGGTATSAEEVALFRLLTELEKVARINRAKCSPEATAYIWRRLRELAAKFSTGTGAVWHP